MRKNKNSLIAPILSLVVLCTLVALLLSSVNLLTKDRIAAIKEQQTRDAIAAIYEDFDTFEQLGVDVELIGSANAIYKVYATGHILQGFAVKASPIGFGGEISLLISMDKNAKILKVDVLHSTETAGVGSRISEEKYLSAFNGKSGKLLLNQDIDSIAGATISSKNLLEGVNDATATCRTLLGLEAE